MVLLPIPRQHWQRHRCLARSKEAVKLVGKPINRPAAAEDNHILNAATCIRSELELWGGRVMALGGKRDR